MKFPRFSGSLWDLPKGRRCIPRIPDKASVEADVVVCKRRFRGGPLTAEMLENPEAVPKEMPVLERPERRLIETLGNENSGPGRRVSSIIFEYRIL